jgi:hypothetical protein
VAQPVDNSQVLRALHSRRNARPTFAPLKLRDMIQTVKGKVVVGLLVALMGFSTGYVLRGISILVDSLDRSSNSAEYTFLGK